MNKHVILQARVQHTYSGRVRFATKTELAVMQNALNKSKEPEEPSPRDICQGCGEAKSPLAFGKCWECRKQEPDKEELRGEYWADSERNGDG